MIGVIHTREGAKTRILACKENVEVKLIHLCFNVMYIYINNVDDDDLMIKTYIYA